MNSTRPSNRACVGAFDESGFVSGSIAAFELRVPGQGMREITREVERIVDASNMEQGLCTVFLPHTSASLVIQENADPSAQDDLERWLNRLVPEDDSLYRHIAEGPDDMPAHIKAALTATSLSIPIDRGRLCLGTWQGIFLWEHRHAQAMRRVIVHIS